MENACVSPWRTRHVSSVRSKGTDFRWLRAEPRKCTSVSRHWRALWRTTHVTTDRVRWAYGVTLDPVDLIVLARASRERKIAAFGEESARKQRQCNVESRSRLHTDACIQVTRRSTITPATPTSHGGNGLLRGTQLSDRSRALMRTRVSKFDGSR